MVDPYKVIVFVVRWPRWPPSWFLDTLCPWKLKAVHVGPPVCGGRAAGQGLTLGSRDKPSFDLYLLRFDLGKPWVGRGESEDPLTCDGFALCRCNKIGVAGLVFVPLSFDIDKLAGCNRFLLLRRLVFVPPGLPNLLEPVVFQGKVLACVLVSGEVQLTRGEAVASNAIVHVGDRLA